MASWAGGTGSGAINTVLARKPDSILDSRSLEGECAWICAVERHVQETLPGERIQDTQERH